MNINVMCGKFEDTFLAKNNKATFEFDPSNVWQVSTFHTLRCDVRKNYMLNVAISPSSAGSPLQSEVA